MPSMAKFGEWTELGAAKDHDVVERVVCPRGKPEVSGRRRTRSTRSRKNSNDAVRPSVLPFVCHMNANAIPMQRQSQLRDSGKDSSSSSNRSVPCDADASCRTRISETMESPSPNQFAGELHGNEWSNGCFNMCRRQTSCNCMHFIANDLIYQQRCCRRAVG
jgi:hypothetical protein